MALGFLRRELESPYRGGSSPPAAAPGPGDEPLLVADRHSVGVNPRRVTTNVASFEAAVRAADVCLAARDGAWADRMAAALDLYAGELLPGMYDDWIFPERQQLEERFCQASHRLVRHYQDAGDLERALQVALRAVAVSRLREEAHQDVIRLHVAAGRPAAALRHYRELERILDRELGIAPAAATRTLVARLLPANGASASEHQPPRG